MTERQPLEGYAENPHQAGWFEVDVTQTGPSVFSGSLHGKPLSFNNFGDAAAALEVIIDLAHVPAAAVLKHKNPCGLATGGDLGEAFRESWKGDEVSAMGSIVGFSQEVDADTIAQTGGKFIEVVVAPAYTPDALEWIRDHKKNMRVIASGPLENVVFEESVGLRGGVIGQEPDRQLYLGESVSDLLIHPARKGVLEPNSQKTYTVGTVTEATFQESQTGLIEFGLVAVKHTKSNAVIIAYEYAEGKYRVLGMGAGQPNRVDAAKKLALPKARENLLRQFALEMGLDLGMKMHELMESGEEYTRFRTQFNEYAAEILSSPQVVAFSEAFFPVRDGPDALAQAGIRYLVQPGGSKADKRVTYAMDQQGVAMILTGMRKFRH